MIVLPSAYLPPVWWVKALVSKGGAEIEVWENYHKQTIRNRCTIDSPNGPLNLTVPVDKTNFSAGGKCLMKDVRISSHSDWQRQHWNALEASYSQSPFFEYLQDDFRPFYEQRFEFLVDFNEALLYKCLELIDVCPKVCRTAEYKGTGGLSGSNGLNGSSGLNCSMEAPQEYYQVFQHKHGFQQGLSVIDLIFNMGPESVFII